MLAARDFLRLPAGRLRRSCRRPRPRHPPVAPPQLFRRCPNHSGPPAFHLPVLAGGERHAASAHAACRRHRDHRRARPDPCTGCLARAAGARGGAVAARRVHRRPGAAAVGAPVPKPRAALRGGEQGRGGRQHRHRRDRQGGAGRLHHGRRSRCGGWSINQYLYARLPYDPERDIVPVSMHWELPNVFAVPAQHVPARTLPGVRRLGEAAARRRELRQPGRRHHAAPLGRHVRRPRAGSTPPTCRSAARRRPSRRCCPGTSSSPSTTSPATCR